MASNGSPPPSPSKPTTPPRQRVANPPINGACTHLTVTRMYTKDLRCQSCGLEAPFGWIYRCTQDRELLLEDEMERGTEDKLDDLCDVFDRPNSPMKRSPAARKSKLSFLEEISDEDLKTYTPAQLNQILTQRAHVLETAEASSGQGLQLRPSPPKPISPGPNPSPSRQSSKPVNKPWLPKQECQFRCCHFCRPTLADRSFLSLDAVLKGDVPPTAVTGFGFHIKGTRPVGLVNDVLNLGLRPNPVPGAEHPRRPPPAIPDTFWSPPRSPSRRSQTPPRSPSLGQGLGIQFSSSEAPASPIRRSATQPTVTVDSSSPYPPEVQAHFNSLIFGRSSFSTQAPRALPLPPRGDVPQPPQRSSSPSSSTVDFSIACLTTLPPQTSDELTLLSAPMTPMEQDELSERSFGAAPLQVNHGVAVTEEAVGLHVPDVVTQF